MIRFSHPTLLLLLIPIACLSLFAMWRMVRMRKSLKRFGDTQLVKGLMPDLSLRRRVTKDAILITALIGCTLALARPQMGRKPEKVKRQGIEVIVCLDVSNSMLTNDVKPSRLELAKGIVSRMVDLLSDDRVGLIFFAHDAFVQLPITSDFVSAKMFLQSASPSLIAAQGTSIGKAISLATRSFSSEKGVERSIVLITDAESHDDDHLAALKEAKEQGIHISVIGVGTEQGAPIPLGEPGEFLMDDEGNMVISKVNPQLAQEIAQKSSGAYILAGNIHSTTQLLRKELDKIAKSEIESTIYREHDEVYHYFLIPALLLLLLDFVYLDRKNRYLRGITLFGTQR